MRRRRPAEQIEPPAWFRHFDPEQRRDAVDDAIFPEYKDDRARGRWVHARALWAWDHGIDVIAELQARRRHRREG